MVFAFELRFLLDDRSRLDVGQLFLVSPLGLVFDVFIGGFEFGQFPHGEHTVSRRGDKATIIFIPGNGFQGTSMLREAVVVRKLHRKEFVHFNSALVLNSDKIAVCGELDLNASMDVQLVVLLELGGINVQKLDTGSETCNQVIARRMNGHRSDFIEHRFTNV